MTGTSEDNFMGNEKDILNSCRTIAVVGLSPYAGRPSYHVASYLKEKGYRIIPVNPQYENILGEKCYPDLGTVPDKVDAVDIFRRSAEVPAIVEQAIQVGVKAIWMQEGIVHEASARRAADAGLMVVMDRCMLKEHQRITASG